MSNKKLTDKPLTLNLTADPDKTENELLISPENEGIIPPNTALMVVTEGTTRTEVRITSDAKKNGVVLFTKKTSLSSLTLSKNYCLFLLSKQCSLQNDNF